MSDVANILGVAQAAPTTAADETARILSGKTTASVSASVAKGKGRKPKGMSRELFSLMGQDGIAPSVQSNKSPLISGFKTKRVSAFQGKWLWAPFSNSARGDHHKFHHWVKAGIEYADYPYSKFNNKIEAVKYSDEEYDVLLQSPLWTRSETDALMDLAYKFDLRWPVVTDRYPLLPPRTLDDLMSRYYFVVSKLKASRSGVTDTIIKSESAHIDIDLEYEKLRRANLEILFRKTKDDEAEEARLKEEIKSIDTAIKRLKKSNAISLTNESDSKLLVKSSGREKQESKTAAAGAAVPASQVESKMPKPHPPAPGKPCLQSSRLMKPDPASVGVSAERLLKASLLMKELGVPERPTPTRVVCDMHDQLYRNTISLLALRSAIEKKEKELAAIQPLNKLKPVLGSTSTHIVVSESDLLTKSVSQENHRLHKELAATQSLAGQVLTEADSAVSAGAMVPNGRLSASASVGTIGAVAKKAPSKRKAAAIAGGASSPVPGAGAEETAPKATKKSKK